MGVRDIQRWNMAYITKLVWAITQKKDCLWVRWVHGRYLREGTCGIIPPKMTPAGIGRKYSKSKRGLKATTRRNTRSQMATNGC